MKMMRRFPGVYRVGRSVGLRRARQERVRKPVTVERLEERVLLESSPFHVESDIGFVPPTAVGGGDGSYDTRYEYLLPGGQSNPSAEQIQAIDALRQQTPDLVLRLDAMLGVPSFIVDSSGPLTGSSPNAPADIALGYYSQNQSLFGLTDDDLNGVAVVGGHTSSASGLRHLYLEQRHNGIAVYQGVGNVSVDASGQILVVGNGFVPDVAATLNTLTPSLTVEMAAEKAAANLGLQPSSAFSVVTPPNGPDQSQVLSTGGISRQPIPARLMIFPMDRDASRLVWQVTISMPARPDAFDVYVDAASGFILARSNLTKYDSYRVFALPLESPADGPGCTTLAACPSHTIVSNPADPLASPFGWHDTNGTAGPEFTATQGNNITAFVDRDGDVQGTPTSGSATNDYVFPFDPTQPPVGNQNEAVVNLFYWTNTVHDVLYHYGFNEVSGNFQVNNYGRGGIGGDPVIATAQSGADFGASDNAFFIPAPEGTSGVIAMFEFTFTNPNTDSDNESGIIIHEYLHGVTTRLVGGSGSVFELNGIQSGGLGEGWSDFYPLAFLHSPGDTATTSHPLGTYVLGNTGGIRRFPYSTDKSVNPLTYNDIDPDQVDVSFPNNPPIDPRQFPANEIHNIGEVWASALWDMYWNLIDVYGYDSNLIAGTGGNNVALRLVTEALKMTPAFPTFLEARDAILQTDVALYNSANQCPIWNAFAGRGMGFAADDGGSDFSVSVTEDFTLPPLCRTLYVVATDPVTTTPPAAPTPVNGPIDHIDFVFSEPIIPASFALTSDIVGFTGPAGANLITAITGASFLPNAAGVANSVLRITFTPQGPAGVYSMTIGPNITDTNGEPMDQDRDFNTGEAVEDRFTATFEVVTPRVVSVNPRANSVVIQFNKDVDPASLTTNFVDPTDRTDDRGVVLERSGGDRDFTNGNEQVVATFDSTVAATGTYDATNFTLTVTIPAGTPLPSDLYRVRIEDNVTDIAPMLNRLDGEFDGPPTAGNDNTFPSGNRVVGGDFLYPFFFGSSPVSTGVVPPVVRLGDPVNVTNLGGLTNESSPMIAVDPMDPLKLVTAYQILEGQNLCVGFGSPTVPVVTQCAAFSFSNDGGATWSFGGVFNPPLNPATVTATSPGQSFVATLAPSVAFDRNHNFYVAYSAASADDNAILLEKFDFSGAFPAQDFSVDHSTCGTALFCGASTGAVDDVARNPVIAIDTNPSVFTDPDSGVVYRDPYTAAGMAPVYVAWDLVRATQAGVAAGLVTNGIQMVASADGAVGFSAPFNVNGFGFGNNAGFFGSDRNVSPSIAVGPALPEIAPGQPDPESGRVHIVWEDFGSSTATDIIRYDRTRNDVTVNGSRGMGTYVREPFAFGPIFDTLTTVSQIVVTERFTIGDVNLDLRVRHDDLRDVRIRLRSPTGTVATVVALGGTAAIANLGPNVAVNNINPDSVGAKLDDEAPVSLQAAANAAGAPFANGVYRPSSPLSVFDGEDSAGVWTLEVQDLTGTSATSVGDLFNWGLQLSGDIGQDSFEFDTFVDTVNLKAACAAVPPATCSAPALPPVSPDRPVIAAPTIAVDTSLGSYSPNQGAIYVAYTERLNPFGAANDTDIFLVTSTDGGDSFQFGNAGAPIHDDHTNENSTGSRTQFQPSLAVDPVTGTLVASWFDARNDASFIADADPNTFEFFAGARVARYVAASIDGGQSFSPNDFVNRAQLEIDNLNVLGPTINNGPIPDNQSGGNPERDTTFGFGDGQGLAVHGGRVYAAWSSNENQRDFASGGRRLDIRVSQAAIAAGPRVTDSDSTGIGGAAMGPVPQQGATPPAASSFTVNFDRPVDPSSFDVLLSGTPLFRADFEQAGDTVTNDGRYGFTISNSIGPDGQRDEDLNGDGIFNNGSVAARLDEVADGIDYNRDGDMLDTNVTEDLNGNGIFNTAPAATGPTAQGPDDGLWHRTTARGGDIGHSPNTSFYFGIGEGTFFGGTTYNNATGTITSPPIDLAGVTGPILLKFTHLLEILDAADEASVRVIVGATTTEIADNVGISNLPDTTNGRFELVTLDLSAFAGQTIQLQFSFTTNGFTAINSTSEGWYIDDVTIAPDAFVIARDEFGQLLAAPTVQGVVPNDCSEFGCTEFTVSFNEQQQPGTYSYTIGPGVRDRIRAADAAGNLVGRGNEMDQDADDATTGRPDDAYSAPRTQSDTATMPLVIPGPHVVSSRGGAEYPLSTVPTTIAIPDGQTITSSISITDRYPIPDLDVLLDIAHARASDLTVTLAHTDRIGTITGPITLFSGVGGTGDDFTRTILDDTGASGPIAGGAAPFTGSFVPASPLAIFGGINLEGVWTLTITDAAGGGGGILSGWSLLVNPNPSSFTSRDATPLADNGQTNATINVDRSLTIRDLNVNVSIVHPVANDVLLRLTSPDPDGPTGPATATTILLVQNVSAGGSNFTNTTFDDEAAVAINAATNAAPYTGAFVALSPLSTFDGLDAKGQWTLEVVDDTGNAQSGVLQNWSMVIDTRTDHPRAFADATPITIADNALANSTITVFPSLVVRDLNVNLSITHGDTRDLDVVLRHLPSGVAVPLVQDRPGGAAAAADFVNTTFDDEGAAIAGAANPFTGRFRPQTPLSVFDGIDAQGDWRLEITDDTANGVAGVLQGWSLLIEPLVQTIGAPAQDENLVLNGTVNFLDIVFDRPIDPDTFKTEDIGRLIGPAGLIGPRPSDVFGTGPIRLDIPDGGTLVSDVVVPQSATIRDLNVQLDITHSIASDLLVQLTKVDALVPANSITITLFDSVGGTADHFIGTILDDEQPVAIDAAASPAVAPFAGRFRPEQSLSMFDGQDLGGLWQLTVTDQVAANGGVGRLESWALVSDPFTITPNPLGTDSNAAAPQTYRIGFPRQILSGTYQVQVGPNIATPDPDGLGPLRAVSMDQDLNAGLDALRDTAPRTKTFTPVGFTQTPITENLIPTLSSIRIEDNFIVRDVDVRLDIAHTNVADLNAFLVFTAQDGVQTRVELFTSVGGTGNDFSQTVLDDEAILADGSPRIIGSPTTSAPFLGRHRPERFNSAAAGTRLADFNGRNARGTWTLELTDNSGNGVTGSLNNWSLTFQTTNTVEPTLSFDQTGMGSAGSDVFTGGFRLFVMDQTDVRATSVWTPLGPAGIGLGGSAGRTGAIAVDPSDPSGNTVFAAGASGGVWKTTDFLTSDPGGPTWMPLTDFGPTYSLNVGSITVFPRNNDPNQTIVYVATGEGDALTDRTLLHHPRPGGIGFLKSTDGGATWEVLDSTDNTQPFAQRTHDLAFQSDPVTGQPALDPVTGRPVFIGTTAFKVIVDYTDPNNVFAALVSSAVRDPNNPNDTGGGVFRSTDGGKTWIRTRPGVATDLAIDPLNPEVLYAGFAGEGVFRTPNRGFRWDLLVGDVGNPQLGDAFVVGTPPIPVNPPTDTPNGAKGRISLAKPPTTDPRFQGWLYAVVANTNDTLNGVYQTKDHGQNWVRLNLPGLPRLLSAPPFDERIFPSNDEALPNVEPFCTITGCSGNYHQSIAVDAVNPNIVYVGGRSVPNLIRIDTTRTYDAHALVAFDNNNDDDGRLAQDTTAFRGGVPPGMTVTSQPDNAGSVVRRSYALPLPFAGTAPDIGSPPFFTRGYNAFAGLQTNVDRIVNSGRETSWQVVTLGEHTGHHDVFTMVDPVTKKSRLIVGTGGGFWTGVDGEQAAGADDACLALYFAPCALSTESRVGTAVAGSGSRNGNLQITQFFYGGVQPDPRAAAVAGTLHVGASIENGLTLSSPDVLNSGQTVASGTQSGDVGSVAVDPTGSGLYYAYYWPLTEPFTTRTEFFLVSDMDLATPGAQIGPHVDGLFQFLPQGALFPEWPVVGPLYGTNFAVNPRDGQQLVISSASGRVYKLDRASDPFASWFQIGDPAIFGNSQAFGLAYGAAAPDTNPNDAIEPDEILYVGTSTGITGGRVFVTFTEGGNTGTDWFDISCSTRSPAPPAPPAPAVPCDLDGTGFSSVRQIVTNLREGSKEAFAVTNNGVYRLADAEAAVNEVRNTTDPLTGRPGNNFAVPWEDITGNLFDVMNTVFDGWNADSAAIDDRIPLLLRTIVVDDRYQIPGGAGTDCATNPGQCHPLIYVGGDAGVYRSFNLGQTWELFPSMTTDAAPRDGGFLPHAIVSDLDLASGPFDAATGLTDFTQSLDLLTASTFGRSAFGIRTSPLILSGGGSGVFNAPDLLDADDSGSSNSDDFTANNGAAGDPLRFGGLTMRGASVELFEQDINGALRRVGATLADPVTGSWEAAVDPASPLDCGPHTLVAQATTFVGTKGPLSDAIVVSVLNQPPTQTAGPDLLDSDDSAGPGGTNIDNLTNVTTPRFSGRSVCGASGQSVPSADIELLVRDNIGGDPAIVDGVGNIYRVIGTGTTGLDGTWMVQVNSSSALAQGMHQIAARALDLAGNIGPVSATTAVTIDAAIAAPVLDTITLDTCEPDPAAPANCRFGAATDEITSDNTLVLGGAAEANSTVTVSLGVGVAATVIGTATANGAGRWTFDFTATTLGEGTHSFSATAIDRAANTSAVSPAFAVRVDRSIAPPSVPDLRDADDTCAPPNSIAPAACDRGSHSDNLTRNTTPTIIGTAEPNSRVDLFSDVPAVANFGSTIADAAGNWSFLTPVALADGLYNLTGRTTDLAGNTSGISDQLALTIDTVPPAAAATTPDLDALSDTGISSTDDITRDTTPTFRGIAEANGIVTLFSGATVLGTSPVDSLGNWTFTVSAAVPLADGPHAITFRNTDPAGNVSGPSGTLNITVDTMIAPPSRPDLDPASDTGNNADDNTQDNTPTFVGTAEANSRVELFSGVISLGIAVTTPAGNWTLTSGMLPDAIHNVAARATDVAGNVSVFSPALVVTIDTLSPLPPTIPDLTSQSDTAGPGGTNTDNITRDNTPTFTGTVTTGTTVSLFSNGALLGTTTPNATGAWTFTVANATPLADGAHDITATVTDLAGNSSLPSASLRVTIDTVILPPSIPDLTEPSDTGVSMTDNITRDNTPTVVGTSEVGSTVTLLDGTTALTPTVVATAGAWNFTTAVLADGVHNLAARAVDVAGNTSAASAALAVTIDTLVATPVITGITEDRGPSATDGVTNDQELIFSGIAEQGSTVTLTQIGVGLFGQVTADPTANTWTLDNTALTLLPGNYSLTAAAVDRAGNISGASPAFNFVIDLTPPVINSRPPLGDAPSLSLASDTGVRGDQRTNLARPTLTGDTEPNIQVQIISTATPPVTLGTGTSDANGVYNVQFAANLADGPHTVRVRATDTAGNAVNSTDALTFTVDTVAPCVAQANQATPPTIGCSVAGGAIQITPPAATLGDTIGQIVVTFTEDLNSTTTGDPAFVGSARNVSNFSLVRSGGDAVFGNANDVPFSLTTSEFVYDSATDRLTINLRDPLGSAATLVNDTWRFTIDGVTSLQDVAGNRIDGDNNASQGPNFTHTFTINVPPAEVAGVRLAGTKKVVQNVFIDFEQPISKASAEQLRNYEMRDAGFDGVFGSFDDRVIPLAVPQYFAAQNRVVLTSIRGFGLNRLYRLMVADEVTSPGGTPIDGDGDGVAGGDFVAFVLRGYRADYRDSDGDFVHLELPKRAGLFDLILDADRDGSTIRLETDVPGQNVTPGRSRLSGRVTRSNGSDGEAVFDTLTGSTGISLDGLPRCPSPVPPTGGLTPGCFDIGDVSASVVDRMLDAGPNAGSILADTIVNPTVRRRRR
jgi:subtilisin-like proprotein convertase family protein